MRRTYREVPIYIVYSPSFCWPGETIESIFYHEEEANEYILERNNRYLFIRKNHIRVDESRDTATE